VGQRPVQGPPAGLSAGGPLESTAATVIALTAWQNRQTFQKLQKAVASSRFTCAAALPIPSPSFPLAVVTQPIDCPVAICEQPSGRAGPTMMRMRGRLLTCFYCGKRSSIRYDGRIRDFRCTYCEATNYLDEVCEDLLLLIAMRGFDTNRLAKTVWRHHGSACP
jgi:hypothetical protein